MANRHGGSRSGAGRKPGSTVKRHRFIDNVPDGIEPVDFLLSIMRDDSQSQQVRIDCAKFAAPYLHPRLAAKQVNLESDQPLVINLVSHSEINEHGAPAGLNIDLDK